MINKITSVDQLIRKLEARKEALNSNPRSLEILEKALRDATRLARLEYKRDKRFAEKAWIGLTSGQEAEIQE